MARQQSTQFHRRFMQEGGVGILSVLAFIIAIFIALPAPCRAERHALIIGIGAYDNVSEKLDSPPVDAKDIATRFRSWKWTIYQNKELVDLNRSALIATFCDFARKLKDGDDVVIFYTGHGWEVGGELFLYPTDAFNEGDSTTKNRSFPSPSDVSCHANYGVGPVSLYRVLGLVGVQLKKLIIFYDACRGKEERFNAEGKLMKQGASKSAVLTVRERLPQSLTDVAAFSYATSPGRSASAGSNRSPYVAAFLLAARSETNFINLLNKMGEGSTSDGQTVDFQGKLDTNYWLGPKPRGPKPEIATRRIGNRTARPEGQSVILTPQPRPTGLQTPP